MIQATGTQSGGGCSRFRRHDGAADFCATRWGSEGLHIIVTWRDPNITKSPFESGSHHISLNRIGACTHARFNPAAELHDGNLTPLIDHIDVY